MRMFFNYEHQDVISEKTLYFEYNELKSANEIEEETFNDYLKNCLDKNGTLLEILTKEELICFVTVL